jgi:hypothetical protein
LSKYSEIYSADQNFKNVSRNLTYPDPYPTLSPFFHTTLLLMFVLSSPNIPFVESDLHWFFNVLSWFSKKWFLTKWAILEKSIFLNWKREFYLGGHFFSLMLYFHVFRQIWLSHSFPANRAMNFRLVNISDVFVQVATLFPAVRARHCRYFSVSVVFRRFLFARKTFKRIVVLTFAADATDTATATEKKYILL